MRFLYESNADMQKFIDYFGKETVDNFYKHRSRFNKSSSPIWKDKGDIKDLYTGMKHPKEALEAYLLSFTEIPSNTQRRKVAKQGKETVYQDRQGLVLKINTLDASVEYGKNTEWCISGSNSLNDSKDFGDAYKFDGYTFYFFVNKITQSKYALQFKTLDNYVIFDECDSMVPNIPNAPRVKGLPDLAKRIAPGFLRSVQRVYDIKESEIKSITEGIANAGEDFDFMEITAWYQTTGTMELNSGGIYYFYMIDNDVHDATDKVNELLDKEN